MGGVCSTYGGEKRCVQGLVGRSEVKRRVRRPRFRCEDNIKVYLQEIG